MKTKETLDSLYVWLSGEFIILDNGQTRANSEDTVTIPEREQTIILSRRRPWTIKIPEQTVTVQGNEQAIRWASSYRTMMEITVQA